MIFTLQFNSYQSRTVVAYKTLKISLCNISTVTMFVKYYSEKQQLQYLSHCQTCSIIHIFYASFYTFNREYWIQGGQISLYIHIKKLRKKGLQSIRLVDVPLQYFLCSTKSMGKPLNQGTGFGQFSKLPLFSTSYFLGFLEFPIFQKYCVIFKE